MLGPASLWDNAPIGDEVRRIRLHEVVRRVGSMAFHNAKAQENPVQALIKHSELADQKGTLRPTVA
jgi:hypothetical protein